MMDPILSKYRYGREDLLALMGKDVKLPEGIKDCPFFVEKAQDPIILGPFTETELVFFFLYFFLQNFIASSTKHQFE